MNLDKVTLRYTFLLTSFLIQSFGAPGDMLAAEDESSLGFSLSAGLNPIGVSMILSDPYGRRTGINLNTNFYIEEIPNSNKTIDGVADDVTGDPGSLSMQISVRRPVLPGIYQLSVFGSTNTHYSLDISGHDSAYNNLPDVLIGGYVASGDMVQYNLSFNPTPGAPAPIITRTITFNVLRNDFLVAQKLNQLGDDKFTNSLIKNINLAEKLAIKCDKHKKDKKCSPAIAVLNMVVKRLEIANRKCDNKNLGTCDEDKDWSDFGKEHRKDRDYNDFFRDWDRDDWHKWKKECKRFVSDEALKIIKEDAQWLTKSLGGETDKRGNHHGGKEKE